MSIERPRLRLGFLTRAQGRDGDIARTYRNAQGLFVAADELGFDIGWVAQHHVPLGGGGPSSPWTFLAHAAARTTRIRLGTAVTVPQPTARCVRRGSGSSPRPATSTTVSGKACSARQGPRTASTPPPTGGSAPGPTPVSTPGTGRAARATNPQPRTRIRIRIRIRRSVK
ncbi:LLM class flavin-dependent oxidoreductase [Streptomyces phaeolivaceus]|uniref:LLM class flavin-dependent oxidoreductase n=1 Tax=Streptomyces phaeolivaceus TaxID=2653200 RepID=UPI001D040E1F|nr:LLM class flavin-dependent oxidoreductase [Streptomyces phaeolivaceus]